MKECLLDTFSFKILITNKLQPLTTVTSTTVLGHFLYDKSVKKISWAGRNKLIKRSRESFKRILKEDYSGGSSLVTICWPQNISSGRDMNEYRGKLSHLLEFSRKHTKLAILSFLYCLRSEEQNNFRTLGPLMCTLSCLDNCANLACVIEGYLNSLLLAH